MDIEQLTPVESSNLAAVGFKDNVLTIRFTNGAVYDYADVPDSVGVDIFEAESVGKYFNSAVRPNFTGVKREPECDCGANPPHSGNPSGCGE